MEKVNSNLAPAAVGPYSQAIATKDLLFISGQLPIDKATNQFAGSDITSQTKQSLENIRHILTVAGLDFSRVVKATVLLSDINDFQAMNKVYGEYFKEPYPARVAYEVANLPLNALVEIAVIVEK